MKFVYFIPVNKVMKKNLHFLIFLLVVYLLLIFNISSSDSLDGETLFKNKCLQCHREGGEAIVIAPSMNASKQWKRFFKKKKHNRRYKDISGLFASDEIEMIQAYLIEHAADSPKPQAFGLK